MDRLKVGGGTASSPEPLSWLFLPGPYCTTARGRADITFIRLQAKADDLELKLADADRDRDRLIQVSAVAGTRHAFHTS